MGISFHDDSKNHIQSRRLCRFTHVFVEVNNIVLNMIGYHYDVKRKKVESEI